MVEFADLDEVKGFFNITDEEIDELLQTLIEHYSTTFIENDILEQNQQTKELLYSAIGCHLTRIKIEKIMPTIAYTIGSVKERFQSPATADRSWCAEFEERFNDIIGQNTDSTYIVSRRRKGIRDLSEFRNPY
jgi:hypothetical protein